MKMFDRYRLVLAFTAMCGCMGLGAVNLPELPDRDGFNIKGYVHDGVQGVPGVLVSDGYSFARTDADGAYYIASDANAKEVFVILPSGYEYAEIDKGVAGFSSHRWQRILPG